ncbi:MAG: hypothetical protein ACRD0I_00685 [Acidimicrobiales bacterium]
MEYSGEASLVQSYAASEEALGALRRARRRRRLANVDFFEALYQAYLVGILAVVVVAGGSGLTGDKRLSHHQLAGVTHHGAAVVGVVLALGVAIALRSGGRGGPLALEAADVRHLLLSPVDRRLALRGPAIQQLRFSTFAGASVGAVAGLIAYHRLPGSPVSWVAVGALCGAIAGPGAIGTALATSGARLPRWAANAIGVGVLAWSAADVVTGSTTSPASQLGRVAIWPLSFNPLAFIGIGVFIVLVGIGLRNVGGQSLEASETRARLVGRLRFAATVRDVRTVMVLRRQLAQERPRSRPWLKLAGHPRAGTKRAIFKRGLSGILRWPARRVARLVMLGAIAGLSMRAAWSGTKPLIVVAGLALWVAALDAVESLAQEVDSPDRLSSHPRTEGWIQVRHLAIGCVVMLGVALVAIAVALPFGKPGVVVSVGVATLVSAVPAAVAGAAVSVVRKVSFGGSSSMFMPEMTGAGLFLRELLPPAIAITGLIPILVARSGAGRGQPAGAIAVNAAFLLFIIPLAAGAWVQSRGQHFGGEPKTRSDGPAGGSRGTGGAKARGAST